MNVVLMGLFYCSRLSRCLTGLESRLFSCFYPLCSTSVTLLLVQTCYNKFGGLDWMGPLLCNSHKTFLEKIHNLHKRFTQIAFSLNCGAILLNTAPTVSTGTVVFGPNRPKVDAESR